jgi:peptidyl-prolyl cis-trans isomerase SurA
MNRQWPGRGCRSRFVLVVAALFAFVRGAAVAEILDGVAAIVNSNIITYSEVRDYVQPVIRQLGGTYEGQELVGKVRAAHLDALNNLIDRQLIIQEFNIKGFSMPQTAVDEQLNDVIAKEFGGNRTAFIKTLEAERLTLSQYRSQLCDNLILRAMRDHKSRQEVIVSPYKIEKYYQDHLDDYKVGDQIKLRMIFIRKTSPAPAQGGDTNATVAPPQIDPQRKLGEEILAKLDAGDSFESMAKLYSEGREAKEGGDWGWIGHDILRKELGESAFSLKPGQHSRLIETDDGFYILQVTDVKIPSTKPLIEVRDEIEKTLLEQQRTRMQEQWVKDLRAKAYIRMY